MPDQFDTCRVVRELTVAADRFAPGHLGELTQIVPFDMVDAALTETGRMQRRVRSLPARVVIYLLLAGALFAECGYLQVWARMIAGLDGRAVASPCAAALAAAHRRLGAAPLRCSDLLRGSAAGPATRGVWWHGRLVVAFDGTSMCCADTPANLGRLLHGWRVSRRYRLSDDPAGGAGRLRHPSAAGGDVRPDHGRRDRLRPRPAAVGPGMVVLGDRNFAAADLIGEITERGADLLIRVKNGRRLPGCARCGDGSWLSRIGRVEVRVICCAITIATTHGRRSQVYQLVTTVLDADCSAAEIVRLYHQRWEIETAYLEIKQIIGAGRVLRARTPAGLDQEVYAVLITYQAPRIAVADATIGTDVDPDRGSFTIALHVARDQVINAAGVITDTVIDLVGAIGRQVLDHPLRDRRCRTSPRVVKRAISKFAAHTASGRLHGPSYKATISIDVLDHPDP